MTDYHSPVLYRNKKERAGKLVKGIKFLLGDNVRKLDPDLGHEVRSDGSFTVLAVKSIKMIGQDLSYSLNGTCRTETRVSIFLSACTVSDTDDRNTVLLQCERSILARHLPAYMLLTDYGYAADGYTGIHQLSSLRKFMKSSTPTAEPSGVVLI